MEDELVRRFGWWITCHVDNCPTENARLYHVTNDEQTPVIVCGPCNTEYSDISFDKELV